MYDNDPEIQNLVCYKTVEETSRSGETKKVKVAVPLNPNTAHGQHGNGQGSSASSESDLPPDIPSPSAELPQDDWNANEMPSGSKLRKVR